LYCVNKTLSALNLAISYTWQINGEERSTIKSPQFNLSDTGSYQITLTAKQLSNGCSASKSKTISILPLPKPIINAGLICQNQPTELKSENAESAVTINLWQWTIDGSKSAENQINRIIFKSSGKHYIAVTATDTIGCESKADTTVIVRPTPSAAFSVLPERGPIPFEINTINSTTDADSYHWQLSNNFTSTAEELNYTFADSGNFDIQLIATNQFGCADTTLRTIIAFVPSTDLLIIQADAEITNNYLQVSALVANNSPYDIVTILDTRCAKP